MVLLDVPYFRQATLGSCGPAALLMVLKYFRPELKLTRLLEFKAWVEAGIFPLGMTESLGLAIFAARSGFTPLVFKEKPGLNMRFQSSYVGRHFFELMLLLFKLGYIRLQAGAQSRGLKVIYRRIDLDLIQEFVEKGLPPIVMVDQTAYAPDEEYRYGILHWVVVVGFHDGEVVINDPDLGPRIRLTKKEFNEAIDLERNFHTDRRMVIIHQSR